MSQDTPPIADESDLETALTRLVTEARESGVRIRGGWECGLETEDDPSEVEVRIAELESRASPDSLGVDDG